MVDTSDSRLGSTIYNDNGKIELVSLSQVLDEVGGKIDLLKMDCEGAEWEIFKDTAAFANIKTIRMEYHLNETHSLESLKEVAARLGYRVERLIPNQGFGIAWLQKH